MYLRPWLLFTGLGLDQSHTVALSVVVIAAMLASFCLLLGRVPAGTGVVAALAVCSPAVMFAVERANMDLALFTVIAAAALLWRAAPRPAAVVSPLLVLIAATAKIYPVFALAAFLVSGRRAAARVAAGCLVIFAAYIVHNRAEVAHVAAIATQGQEFSYGARILPAHLYHQLGADHWAGPAAVKQGLVALPLGLVALALAVVVRRRLGRVAAGPEVASAPKLALHAGAAIYLGTFVMANNFDYRLVFQ
jgi:hypothetical protein